LNNRFSFNKLFGVQNFHRNLDKVSDEKGESMRKFVDFQLTEFFPKLFILLILTAVFNSLVAGEPALAESPTTIEITGEGVSNPLTLTLAELEAMEQYEHVYSTINTWPTKRWYAARGVKLRELLSLAGIKEEATLIRFVSSDGYDVTLTLKELLKDKRYYFPGLKENHPSDGSIAGSPEGAQEVEPILALVSAEGSDDLTTMNDRDALLFILGQRAVTEQTNNLFLKYVIRIEVLTATPEKWDTPKANIPSGTVVPAGTKIELSNKHNNEDKIYYTTDGSTPTINSPMFNWSASRWWDQRDDVKAVNKAIEVNKDTVIKMITIGPGKEDSDVVTFTFTADLTGKAVDPTKVPGGPPTGVTLDQNTIRRPVGSTFKLTADIAPFNATDKDVTWSSSDTRIATVDNHGLVTVVGPGTAIITVKTVVGGHTDVCIVNGPDEAENNQNDDPVAVDPADNEMPESIPEPPVPETEPQDLVKDLENNTGSAVSGVIPEVPEESQIPEDKAQFLIEKDALSIDTAADIALPEPGIQNSQVFEVSAADTVPLPLKEKRNWVNVCTSGSFFLLLFSGAGRRYAEYKKER
jgi:hypothetical protein